MNAITHERKRWTLEGERIVFSKKSDEIEKEITSLGFLRRIKWTNFSMIDGARGESGGNS